MIDHNCKFILWVCFIRNKSLVSVTRSLELFLRLWVIITFCHTHRLLFGRSLRFCKFESFVINITLLTWQVMQLNALLILLVGTYSLDLSSRFLFRAVWIFLSYHECFWFIFSVCFFFQFLFDCLFDSSCSGFWAF